MYNSVVRLCQFFCCGGKANLVQIFLLNLRIFFLYFFLCMDLQPYSHNSFSKISRTLFDFGNTTYWVSSFKRNNLLIFWTGVSCSSVTLFYSTLLALTHGQNHRRRNKYTRFTWAGGTFFSVVLLCCVSFWLWREMRELALHYFLADCFGIEREIVFGVMYVLSVQYSCAVVSVLLLWREG